MKVRFLVLLVLLALLVPMAFLVPSGSVTARQFDPASQSGSLEHCTAFNPRSAPQAAGLERVGQLGGAVRAVAAQGNYAYVGMGQRLAVLDISSPTTPWMVGQTGDVGQVTAVAVAGNYAYAVRGDDLLWVIDVSDPSAPAAVGSYDFPSTPKLHDVATDGSFVYLAAGIAGLRVMDVSDPTAPAEIGAWDTASEAHGVAVSGDYAYVADWADGLRVIDVSDPAAPVEVGALDTPGDAFDVVYTPYYALVADGLRGLRVIQVSDPTAPAEVSAYDPWGASLQFTRVFEWEGYAFVVDGYAGLRILDLGQLPGIYVWGSQDTPGIAVDVHVVDPGYAFVADEQGGLRVIQFYPVSEVGVYAPLTDVGAISVAGSHAYAADGDAGLRIIDVSNPAAPVERGVWDTPGTARGVYAVGSHAYVADGTFGLRVVDVSDPAAPAEAGAVDTPGDAQAVYVAGSYAYLADGSSGLRVIDVSNPAAPAEVGSNNTPGTAMGVYVAGTYAYVADASQGLRVIDVSNPVLPVEVGSFDGMTVYDVHVAGPYAYAGTRYHGLRVLDVSNPAAPAEVGYLEDSHTFNRVFVAKDYAYVTDKTLSFLGMIDVSNPAAPVQVDDVWLSGYTRDVFVAGLYVYLVADGDGLVILRRPWVDLTIDSVAPVQSIEGQDLVRDKATAVKAVIHKIGTGVADDVAVQAQVGAALYTQFYVADYANVDPTTYALLADNTAYPLDFPTGEVTKTIYFFADGLAPTGGAFSVSATVDPAGDIDEMEESNNTAASGPVAVHDTQWPPGGGSPDLDIFYFPVDWMHTARFSYFCDRVNEFFLGVYPVAEARFQPQKATITHGNTAIYGGLDGRLNKYEISVWALRQVAELMLMQPTADYYVAVVPDDWFATNTSGALAGVRGIAFPNLSLVVAETMLPSRPNGPVSVLHEIGHGCGLHTEIEEYDDPAADQPLWGNYADSGLWVEKKIPILVDPNDPPDSVERAIRCFMGRYEASREWWIDAADYTHLLTSTQVLATQTQTAGDASDQAILVLGTLDVTGTMTLDDWYVLPEAEPTPPQPGPYVFEYQDAGGGVLYQQSFDLSFRVGFFDTAEAGFAFVMPYVPGTARIVIKENGVPLAQRDISSNSPAVSVVAPNGGEQIIDQTTVRWSGHDDDGDTLTYAILVSPDDGASWETVEAHLAGTSYLWDVSSLPAGSHYRLKVVATDSVNTGQDTSNASFAVRRRTYLPLIVKNG
jgi:hypothetical protein